MYFSYFIYSVLYSVLFIVNPVDLSVRILIKKVLIKFKK